MGTKTIRIELRYSSDTDNDRAIQQVARQCAQTMMASAMLISQGRSPQIAVTSEDLFAANEEVINLLEDDGGDEEQKNEGEVSCI